MCLPVLYECDDWPKVKLLMAAVRPGRNSHNAQHTILINAPEELWAYTGAGLALRMGYAE